MEVMRNAVVKYRTLKPLPGEITSAKITDAALPLKIEAARRAIAACTDLPELLKMKDQAEGLAAAVRIMKTVGPEMIHNANCLLADAWRKGGELLSQYNNTPRNILGYAGGAKRSERMEIATSLGLRTEVAGQMVRLANAPESLVHEVVQKTSGLGRAAASVPRVPHTPGRATYRNGGIEKRSETFRQLARKMSIAKTAVHQCLSENFGALPQDERKVVKAKIVEIQELLDTMDQLCKV